MEIRIAIIDAGDASEEERNAAFASMFATQVVFREDVRLFTPHQSGESITEDIIDAAEVGLVISEGRTLTERIKSALRPINAILILNGNRPEVWAAMEEADLNKRPHWPIVIVGPGDCWHQLDLDANRMQHRDDIKSLVAQPNLTATVIMTFFLRKQHS